MVKTPFHNEKDELKFPIRALRDLCYIWPLPAPEAHNTGLIEIPQIYQENYLNGIGVLVSIGGGFYNPKFKQFVKPDPKLIPGVKVAYDVSIPWYIFAIGQDKVPHRVVYCSTGDIRGLVDE
jgi:hypothetical protein